MSTSVTLRVRTPPSDWGTQLCVTGSTPHFSSWGATAPLPLHTAGPYHTITLTLPANTTFEYKYVSVTAGEITRWEQFPHPGNRTLRTSAPGTSLTIDDGVVGDDTTISVFRTTPLPASPAPQPAPPALPDTDTTAAAAALTTQLDLAHGSVESVRAAVRALHPTPPDEELAQPAPPDEELAQPAPPGEELAQPAPPASTDPPAPIDPPGLSDPAALALVQRCVEDGAALVSLLRSATRTNPASKPAPCRRSPFFVPVTLALAAALLALLVALAAFSLPLAADARATLAADAKAVLAAARATALDVDWRGALARLWRRVLDGALRLRKAVCNAAGWPDWCGPKLEAGSSAAEDVAEAANAVSTQAARDGWLASVREAVLGVVGEVRDRVDGWLPRRVGRFLGSEP